MENNVFIVNPELPSGFNDSLKVSGFFKVEVIRNGKVIHHEFFNAVTNEGLNNMLGVTFHGDTQQTTWYALLISNTSYSVLAAGDTMASHAGWTESSAYSESVRQTWTCGAPASKSITNSTPMTFSINADSTTIKGIAIVSNSTKGGTTGKLWSTGLFSSDILFANGDFLKVTYTVNLS